jgi:hypothetical protein
MGASIEGEVDEIIARHRACVLRGRAFFVAWHGTLTLAFQAWSEDFARLKRALNEIDAMQAEAFGSKWPKISLGCLKSDDAGGGLTMEEYEVLRDVCDGFRGRAERDARVRASELKVVVFGSRCCERRVSVKRVKLRPEECGEEASRESVALVESVLSEGRRDEEYLNRVNAPGHRACHYEQGSGVTLVADALEGNTSDVSDLTALLLEFRSAVEKILPGRFRWFRDDSLHVTVRGLVN